MNQQQPTESKAKQARARAFDRHETKMKAVRDEARERMRAMPPGTPLRIPKPVASH